MKKATGTNQEDDLRPEYDFAQMKGGVRGKYAARYRAGTNLVRLEPDVAKAFGTDKLVNDALRSLIHQQSGGGAQET